MSKRKELYAGIGLLFIAVFYLFSSNGIVQAANGLGPRTMPHLIGTGLMILSFFWIVESSTVLRKEKGRQTKARQQETSDYVRVVLTFLLISGFAALLRPLGFCLSAFAYLLFQITLLTPKEQLHAHGIVKNAAIAMAAAIVITLVFSHGLGVPLPRGNWLV